MRPFQFDEYEPVANKALECGVSAPLSMAAK